MTHESQQAQIAELHRRLEEAEETIAAIQGGAVDAFVVRDATGSRVFTLETADRPYRLLVEQMQQGAATLYRDGTVAYCNRRLADLLAVEQEKLIGAPFRDSVEFPGRSAYDGLFQRSLTGTGQAETFLSPVGGAPVPVMLTLNTLPDDSGAAVGLLVTNLTAQKHQEKLAAAYHALKQSDIRKTEFLATLAHELRNPLSTVAHGTQILLKGGEAGQVQEVAGLMNNQVKQLVRLIDDLLDASRINRGKLALKPHSVELGTVIEGAVDSTRSVIEEAGHRLTVSHTGGPITLPGDGARLMQVVTNLLTNAARYTPPSGQITLATAMEGGQAVIRVRDNGIGIGPDKLTEIFDMFVQGDSLPERGKAGLGIGLALAKKLVEMHGGTIEAQSEGTGRGSTFTLRLPGAIRSEQRRGTARGTEAQVDEPTPQNPRRVLVVEDSGPVGAAFVMLLEMMGHRVRLALSGPEAIQMIESEKPEVLFSDISMPGMTGYELAAQVRGRPELEGMVMVAVTGYGQPHDVEMAMKSGFHHHLVKPPTIEALNTLFAKMGSGSL